MNEHYINFICTYTDINFEEESEDEANDIHADDEIDQFEFYDEQVLPRNFLSLKTICLSQIGFSQ